MSAAANDITQSRVTSSDGTELAVYSSGPKDAPTIVGIHGYPDNHSVWDPIASILSKRFHVVTYDVRGAGESDKPKGRRAYRMPQLSDDLMAVIDSVSPRKPVHLLAHDWGSIQTWESVTAIRFEPRLLSFTSVSGPSLDMAGIWMRANVRADPEKLRNMSRQLLESYYTVLFQIPLLPEGLWKAGLVDRFLNVTGKVGSVDPDAAAYGEVPREMTDCLNGIELYRANIVPRLVRPRPKPTDVPVQVLAPSKDLFVSEPLQTQAPLPFASDFRSTTFEGGHWSVVDQPELIAELTEKFIDSL